MHDQITDIPCVILAGGSGTRMGGIDKCLLKLGDTPLLQRQIDTLRAQTHSLMLSANGDTNRFSQFGLPVLRDSITPPAGPLGGLSVALESVNKTAQWCLSVAADCPFLPEDLCARLFKEAKNGHDIVYCQSAGKDHYVIALWATHLHKAITENINEGKRSVRHFIAEQNHSKVVFESTPVDPFFNINTPEQWEQCQDLIKGERI